MYKRNERKFKKQAYIISHERECYSTEYQMSTKTDSVGVLILRMTLARIVLQLDRDLTAASKSPQ